MPADDHDWGPIRKRLEGRRIAVISNRNDKPLKATLEECLGVKVKWCVAEGNRRLDSLKQSLAQGSFDTVIALTGFVKHRVEAVCSKAARKGGILYVRADKGRPTAVYLALKRDLGIE